jgi:hypothetical protein
VAHGRAGRGGALHHTQVGAQVLLLQNLDLDTVGQQLVNGSRGVVSGFWVLERAWWCGAWCQASVLHRCDKSLSFSDAAPIEDRQSVQCHFRTGCRLHDCLDPSFPLHPHHTQAHLALVAVLFICACMHASFMGNWQIVRFIKRTDVLAMLEKKKRDVKASLERHLLLGGMLGGGDRAVAAGGSASTPIDLLSDEEDGIGGAGKGTNSAWKHPAALTATTKVGRSAGKAGGAPELAGRLPSATPAAATATGKRGSQREVPKQARRRGGVHPVSKAGAGATSGGASSLLALWGRAATTATATNLQRLGLGPGPGPGDSSGRAQEQGAAAPSMRQPSVPVETNVGMVEPKGDGDVKGMPSCDAGMGIGENDPVPDAATPAVASLACTASDRTEDQLEEVDGGGPVGCSPTFGTPRLTVSSDRNCSEGGSDSQQLRIAALAVDGASQQHPAFMAVDGASQQQATPMPTLAAGLGRSETPGSSGNAATAPPAPECTRVHVPGSSAGKWENTEFCFGRPAGTGQLGTEGPVMGEWEAWVWGSGSLPAPRGHKRGQGMLPAQKLMQWQGSSTRTRQGRRDLQELRRDALTRPSMTVHYCGWRTSIAKCSTFRCRPVLGSL